MKNKLFSTLALACWSLCLVPSTEGRAQSGTAPTMAEIGVVQIEGGVVKGIPTDIEGVQVFRGIPYAGPVGGDNRWKPPVPVEPWSGVKVADTWGDQVLQDYDPSSGEPPATENGLNLNVFTPAKSTADKLPVYVLVHGGANRGGNNSDDTLYASKLAARGIVVVSVHYRTGPFGFLALPELAKESPEGVTGNYGVLDLIKALRWVNTYAAGFGGDPDTVTIGGQSAGAENVTALLRTPLAKGLYERAFISSGFTGFLPGKFGPMDKKAPANQAGVDKVFGRPMSVRDLRAIPAQDYISPWKGEKDTLQRALHQAAIRGEFYAIDGHVFTDESIDLMRPGALTGLDIMIGGTADEYTSLRGGEDRTMTPNQFDSAMKSEHGYGRFGTFGSDYKKFYRPETGLDAYRLYLRSLSDRQFAGYRISAEYAKSHNDDLNVYVFYWDHAPPGRNEGFKGAYHAADLYFFNQSLRDAPRQPKWTDPDHRMVELASSYLANFIKTGDPNGEGLPVWGQATHASGGQFIRFVDGYAIAAKETPHPSRDGFNRNIILKANALTEEQLAK